MRFVLRFHTHAQTVRESWCIPEKAGCNWRWFHKQQNMSMIDIWYVPDPHPKVNISRLCLRNSICSHQNGNRFPSSPQYFTICFSLNCVWETIHIIRNESVCRVLISGLFSINITLSSMRICVMVLSLGSPSDEGHMQINRKEIEHMVVRSLR
jgi:hypothetical protein